MIIILILNDVNFIACVEDYLSSIFTVFLHKFRLHCIQFLSHRGDFYECYLFGIIHCFFCYYGCVSSRI